LLFFYKLAYIRTLKNQLQNCHKYLDLIYHPFNSRYYHTS